MKFILAILLSCILVVISGCAFFVSEEVYEVDKNVNFGKKLKQTPFGLVEGIFPYVGAKAAPAKDFEFQCNDLKCVSFTSGFGMPGVGVIGIAPIPFFPIFTPQEKKRDIQFVCASPDISNFEPLPVTIHSLQGNYAPTEISTYREQDSAANEMTVVYHFEIEKVEFDRFDLEVGGACNNLNIPYDKTRSSAYIPIVMWGD